MERWMASCPTPVCAPPRGPVIPQPASGCIAVRASRAAAAEPPSLCGARARALVLRIGAPIVKKKPRKPSEEAARNQTQPLLTARNASPGNYAVQDLVQEKFM